jgi:hypothetical protein
MRISRKEFYFLFSIVVLGILFRMAYLEDYRLTKVFQPLPFSDSYFYAQRAQDIVAGKFLSPKIFISWPLYAYVLAFLFKISGAKILFVYGVHFLMGVGNAAAVYFIGRRLFNPAAGFFASLLCLSYGTFMFYEGLLIYTTLSLLLNSFFLLFILRSPEPVTRRRSFLAGVFLGVCTLAQANLVLFGPVFFFRALWHKKAELRRGIATASLFAAGFFLMAGIAAGMNYLADKDPVLFSRNAGLNIFLGNNPEANGVFRCPAYLTATQEGMYRDAKITAQMAAGRELRSSEVSRFWIGRSITFVREQPRAFLRLLARKVLFSPGEFFSDPEFKFVFPSVRVLKILFLDLRLILPLAIAGMILAARKWKDCFFLYAATAAALVNIPLFFFQAKLRIGAVPFLAVFAGYAVYAVGSKLRQKKFTYALLLTAGITAFGFFLGRPFSAGKAAAFEDAYAAYRYHFDTAMYYETKADYSRALEELKLARDIRPNNHHVLFCLGVAVYQLNDFKAAEDYFYQAIRVFPLYIDAHYNLGFLFNQQGRFEEAAAVLRTAVYFDPDDPGSRFELARAYEGMKDFEKAKAELRQALSRGTALSPAEKKLVARKLTSLH